jgi:hypothetical protein
LADGVALTRILVLVERVGNVAVAVAAGVVVDRRADIGFVAVDMCGRMKVRVDVSSEAEDGPFRWDSGMTVVPSASESVGGALS